MALTCWYDYTCPYSYRAFGWLRDEDVEWRTFSLKEADSPPALASIGSMSVLALALAHVAREAPGADFAAYHAAVFEALHSSRRRVGPDDLRAIARRAGADPNLASVEAVAAEHARGVELGVSATPTLAYDGGGMFYLKLAAVPAAGTRLRNAVEALAVGHPEVLELKRPGRG